MQKKKQWNYWWGYILLSLKASQSLTKTGYHKCCEFKEKAIWEGKIVMLWIPLTQYASANTESLHAEIKFELSTQGAPRAGFLISPLYMCEFLLDSGLVQDSFRTYMHFQDIQSIHFFQNQTAPHPTHPPLPPTPHIARLRNGPPEQSWNFPRLIFPLLRNMCFMFQSFIITTFQVRCMFFAFIRNFVTYAELI